MFEKIEAWKEEYLIAKHIFLNFEDYPNIKLNFPIGMFLILMAIAFCVACFFMYFNSLTAYRTVKQLIRHGAIGEENAKTLKAMRLDDSHAIKRKLSSRSGHLSSLVTLSGYVKPSYDEYVKRAKKNKNHDKINFDEAKFYIAIENKEEAELLIQKENPSIWKPILLSLVFLILSAVLFILMPNILELINGWLAE